MLIFLQLPVAEKVEQLQKLTSNTDQLGITEIIASVHILRTATEDVFDNLTVSKLRYIDEIMYFIAGINIFRNC